MYYDGLGRDSIFYHGWVSIADMGRCLVMRRFWKGRVAVAHIFTYEKTWQQHLEKRLGLKPIMDNDFGGKEYEIEKRRIKPPRAPVRLSVEIKRKRRAERLARMRSAVPKPNPVGISSK